MLLLIAASPELWPCVAGEQNVRRAGMTPSRYGSYLIFFHVTPHVVAILRVVDGRRRPSAWKKGGQLR
jgi:hypothetical protein